MRWVVGLMIGVFGLVGFWLIGTGLSEFFRRMNRRSAFLPVTGTIMRVERRQLPRDVGRRHLKPSFAFHPVIRYDLGNGQFIEFMSETGEVGHFPRYQTGDRVELLVDPEDRSQPMLNTWAAIWGPSLTMIAAGLFFLLGSAVAVWAFGRRVMGTAA